MHDKGLHGLHFLPNIVSVVDRGADNPTSYIPNHHENP
jgi:hypothetical protein